MALTKYQEIGHIARITLNDPKRLNALSEEMLSELSAHFSAIHLRSDIRVVVIAAEGKAFCAGHDLKQMTAGRDVEDGGSAYFDELFATCSSMMLQIHALPQPVIAEVHGIATAAGCQLVATCDLALAAEGTRFGINGINIGLFCSTPIVALSRNINRKKALEMGLTGDFILADEAERLGLINKVTRAESLTQETMAMAEKIANKLSSAVKIGKIAFYEQATLSTKDAYKHMGFVMRQNMLDEDTEEGIEAFLEKRQPNWA